MNEKIYYSAEDIVKMEKIQKEVSKHSGVEVPEMLIEPLLRNGIGDRTDAVAMTTKRIAENYTAEIMKKLTAHGYREELVHLYIIGGGGWIYVLMQKVMRYLP